MGLFSLNLKSFDDLYVAQLKDLYSAESQLVDALPKMADAAAHPDLKQAFMRHLETTRRQKDRLEQIGKNLGKSLSGETCEAMKGLVKEGQEIIDADGDEAVRDAGLIAAAQRVEHYEIAGYGTVRTFAERLRRDDDARLLAETLAEEEATDDSLTQLAESIVNPFAAEA
ncbi:ferritin-like domain-containing protein [Rubrivirga sp. S365]|uniref:Ferritin-like domain-containing protein n=1 Tax=Rubrivirga litoralis TaxID=3075598 RepID=A0ABU3BU40_9BACT|nr:MULTISPECIES: ferritin-like domain-containing protein [unclassified Rubrivirga]MDT0632807.1 ferritin-like domain-containing protein [Rubrivirga sp. F394]MDT7857498.1 ferritin-like domain-containing protein [Rubrivirga sp. S365]